MTPQEPTERPAELPVRVDEWTNGRVRIRIIQGGPRSGRMGGEGPAPAPPRAKQAAESPTEL